MTLDERTLRAAGLPASLISLLVSITKAAERATAAANTAATANDLAPQVAAALQALQAMEVVPGLRTQVDQIRERLLAIENSPPPDSYDDTAVINRLAAVEAATASIPQPYNDGPILQRIAAVEGAVAESVEIVSLISRDGLLVALLSNGSEIIGPEIGGGSAPVTAPAIVSTIADRFYIVGQSIPATDLRTKFSGAASYVISPAISQAVINGYNLEFYPSGPLAETAITVRGVNAGGLSDPLTFKLRIDAASPEVVNPLPDQSLTVGGETVTIPLDERFTGAAVYLIAPEGQGAAIIGRNLVLSASEERSLEITVTATNDTGQSASDTFMFTVGAVTQAPAVQAAPTISGNTTVGGILTRTAGTATGIPAPSRATVWLRNGDPITGQTGNTLDTTGFAVDDAITTRDVWTNIQGTATGTSAAVTLTVQPTLQATITPDPLVAGEDFEILFSAAPDSVSPLTLVRDADDPRRYTGTAPDSGTLAIGATKAGYQPWSQTYTYDPAPVVEPGSITVESDGTISITVPDDAEPFDVQIGADVVALDPAAYTPTDAPVALGQPDISGTGGDGEVLTVQSRALFAGHADAGEIAVMGGWYRNDTAVGDTDGSYTQDDAADGDRTLTWRETATNTAGSTVAVSNGVLCPASEIPALPAGLSVVGLFEGEPSGGLTATHTAPISLGGADPQKTIYVLVRALSSVSSGKIIVGGTEYPLTLHHVTNLSSGNNRMALLSANVPAGGQATLSVTTTGTWSGALSAYVLATKAMTLVTSSMAFVSMAAGTAITQNVADTQVGDQFLAAVMAAPYDQAGIFGSAVAVTERLDQPLATAGPQLWVGTGTETAAINPRPVRVTPSQPGNAIRLIAHFRSAA